MHGDANGAGEKVEVFLTAAEVAALLRVSTKTIYDAAARGEIPGEVRFGRTLRFRRDEVLAWSGQPRVVTKKRRRPT